MSDDTYKKIDQFLTEQFLDQWYRVERLEERYFGRHKPTLTALPRLTTDEERKAAWDLLKDRVTSLEGDE